MQKLPLLTATLSGTAIADTWSQALILPHQKEDGLMTVFTIVVALERNDNQDAAFFGRALVKECVDGLATSEIALPEKLKQTLALAKKIIDEESGLRQSAVVVGGITENQLTVAKIGNATASLFRDGVLIYVLPREKEMATVTGPLKPLDYIILGTDAFFEHAYPTSQVFDSQRSPEQIVEILSPTLLALPSNADIAACLLKVPEVTVESQLITPAPPPVEVVVPAQPKTVGFVPQKRRPTLYGLIRRNSVSRQTTFGMKRSWGHKRTWLAVGIIVLLAVCGIAGGGWYWQQTQKRHNLAQSVALASQSPVPTPTLGPKVLFDLTVYKEGIKAGHIKAQSGVILVTDSSGPTILRLNAVDVTGHIASGGAKVPNLVTAFFNGPDGTAVTRESLLSIDQSSGDTAEIVKKDSLWGTIVDADSYLGNVYLLDAANAQIWKYAKTDSGFATIKNMVDDASKSKLGQASDIAIDGVIWVASEGGIVKVSTGQVVPFLVQPLDKPFGKVIKVATGVDVPIVYILDTENHRIVVAKKDGQFVEQYAFEDIASVVDIASDASTKALYMLTSTKILSLPIVSQ